LKAGGVGFGITSAEWPLWRCTVDVTACGADSGGCDMGQRALANTCLESRRKFNDAVSSSDCVVSILDWLVNSEGVAAGDRGLVDLYSRN